MPKDSRVRATNATVVRPWAAGHARATHLARAGDIAAFAGVCVRTRRGRETVNVLVRARRDDGRKRRGGF